MNKLGIDSQPGGGPVRQPYKTYRLARLHRLAESVPWDRFLGSLSVYKFGLWAVVSGGKVLPRPHPPNPKTNRLMFRELYNDDVTLYSLPQYFLL